MYAFATLATAGNLYIVLHSYNVNVFANFIGHKALVTSLDQPLARQYGA